MAVFVIKLSDGPPNQRRRFSLIEKRKTINSLIGYGVRVTVHGTIQMPLGAANTTDVIAVAVADMSAAG